MKITIEAEHRKNKNPFILKSIDKSLARVIEHYYKENEDSIWLFTNSRKNKHCDDCYRQYLAKISQKVLGKRLTPHMFRHSIVTELSDMGLSPKNIMAITGHVDLKVFLKHYDHSTEEGREKVLAKTNV